MLLKMTLEYGAQCAADGDWTMSVPIQYLRDCQHVCEAQANVRSHLSVSLQTQPMAHNAHSRCTWQHSTFPRRSQTLIIASVPPSTWPQPLLHKLHAQWIVDQLSHVSNGVVEHAQIHMCFSVKEHLHRKSLLDQILM